jgi:hypothetical protein
MAVLASTYNAQDTRAKDPLFVVKVQQAIVTAAIQIQAELQTTLHHSERAALAIQVLASPATWAALMAQGVASNAAIVDASLDSDIQFQVNAQWNAYGVKG